MILLLSTSGCCINIPKAVLHILFRIDIELFEKMVQVDIPLSSRFINAEKIASHHILSLTDDEGLNALRILHESKDIKL